MKLPDSYSPRKTVYLMFLSCISGCGFGYATYENVNEYLTNKHVISSPKCKAYDQIPKLKNESNIITP
jgi:hypothetical protein